MKNPLKGERSRFSVLGISSMVMLFSMPFLLYPVVVAAAPATGSITVHKVIENPDGDVITTDTSTFTVTLNEGSMHQVAQDPNSYTYSDLEAGTYTIEEVSDSNYELLSYSIDENGEESGAQITVEPGSEIDVVITNRQRVGHLTVIKHVDNTHETGSHDANDFTFKINDQEYDLVGDPGMDAQHIVNLNPGTYTVGEVDNMGYAVAYSQDCINVVIESNGQATCTITNYDLDQDRGAISIIKNLVNDNGGDAQVSDFTLKIHQEGQDDVTLDSGQVMQFEPGTYTVSEDVPEELQGEYSPGVIVCIDIGEGTELDGNTITLEVGHVYQCVITNDDIPGTLTITKYTSSESYDGTFSFTISGTSLQPTITTSSGLGQTSVQLSAGYYNLQEVVPPGWNFSGSSCDYGEGNEEGYSIPNGEYIEIENGSHLECTFNNTRQFGNLRVIKVVEGNEEVSSSMWSLHVKSDGAEVDGSPQPGDYEGTTYLLPVDSYTVTETNGPVGYLLTFSGDCDSGGNVMVPNNGLATCTLTNTRAANLVVKKVVVNDSGGSKSASDFSFQINDGQPITFEADGQNDVAVPAGSYSVTEVVIGGYKASYQNCTGVELALGQEKICTITNDDVDPHETSHHTTSGSSSSFVITASADTGGSISPAGNVPAVSASTFTFVVSPQPGFTLADVLVDNVSMGAVTSYTFSNINNNHTIVAMFAPGIAQTPPPTQPVNTFTPPNQGTGGGGTTGGQISEQTGNEVPENPEEGGISFPNNDQLETQAAAVSQAGGFGYLLYWFQMNWWWLLLLVLFALILYWAWQRYSNTPVKPNNPA